MKYFKNTELAKLHNVSEKTVRNWIQASLEGKLGLQLYEHSGKPHVANTSKNVYLMEQQAKKGKKYRNSRGSKIVTPAKEFYTSYSRGEVIDIITNLDVHREIPHKYSYFGEGATYWDHYSQRMADEPSSALTSTIQLLNTGGTFLDNIMEDYSGVNVIDLGLGNALPVKELLEHLLQMNMLHRYIAIDTSVAMLDIGEKNITQWFGDNVRFERYVRDVNYDMFNDLILEDTFKKDGRPILNIVLLIGGTIANLRDPDLALRTIGNSLGKNDLFIISRRLDTPSSRRFFDFDVSSNFGSYMKEKANLNVLGIDDSLYELEQHFDAEYNRRLIRAKLKTDVTVQFKLGDKERAVEFHKGEAIILWYAFHTKLIDLVRQFDDNGFNVLQITESKDQQYVQVISKIKAS